jgi:ADP-ribose pyrophosphatase YjhB (NUDIX family)
MGTDQGMKNYNHYYMNNGNAPSYFPSKWMILSVVLSCLLLYELITRPSVKVTTTPTISTTSPCAISYGQYRGVEYVTREGGTQGTPKCLVESKWMKVQQHVVQLPGSSNVIPDWLWIDYHDRINVLVTEEPLDQDKSQRRFLILEQTKYALEGQSSWAVVGGIIEPGETPEHAAQREVEEELRGITCQHYHLLGRFRTDVNRGMGWVNSFLATQCSRTTLSVVAAATTTTSNNNHAEEVGIADTERQDLRRVTLSELREAARKGQFLEVQWSATVGLALLHPELTE